MSEKYINFADKIRIKQKNKYYGAFGEQTICSQTLETIYS